MMCMPLNVQFYLEVGGPGIHLLYALWAPTLERLVRGHVYIYIKFTMPHLIGSALVIFWCRQVMAQTVKPH